MEFLSGISGSFSVGRALQFAGAAGMVASGGWTLIQVRDARQTAHKLELLQTTKRDLSHVQQKELNGQQVQVIHQVGEVVLNFSADGHPTKKTLKQLHQLLGEHAAISPAIFDYRREANNCLIVMTHVPLQVAYSALHGRLENVIRSLEGEGKVDLKEEVKAIQDKINFDELVSAPPTPDGLRELKVKLRGFLSSMQSLLNEHRDQFSEQDAQYVQDIVIAETERESKDSSRVSQKALGALFIAEGETPLAKARSGLDLEVKPLVVKHESVRAWREKKISLWQKAVRVFTPEYPHQKPLLLGVAGLSLAIFGMFSPAIVRPVLRLV
jgi:hypothetical protein